MPRIPGPTEPRGPSGVVSTPRPREVRTLPTMPAIKSPLVQFGQELTGSSLSVANFLIQQERSALQTQLQTQAVEELGALEGEVDRAGTASQAHSIWDQRFPKLVERLEKSAADAGMPEFAGDLGLMAARAQVSTLHAIGKRSAREGADNAAVLATAYEQKLTGARTQSDYMGVRAELHGRLQQVAETNPLVTPGDADKLLIGTVTNAAKRRATAMVEAAVNSQEALQAARASILDEDQHPDLPLDARADLARLATSMEEAAINREWQQMRRQEMLMKEAREQHQLATMQGFMGRLANDDNVTDQELALSVAQGAINPSAYNFLQSVRDNNVENNPDVFVYDDHRAQAEYGMLGPDEVYSAMSAGAYEAEQGRQLLNTNATSRRQGGVLRDAEVQAAADLIDQVVLGAVGDTPGSEFFALWGASDQERKMATRLKVSYFEEIRRSVAEGTPPDALNPRRTVGRLLGEAGFGSGRPTTPTTPGPADLSVLGGMSAKDVEERVLPAMVDMKASGSLARSDALDLDMQINATRMYLDQMHEGAKSAEMIKTLTEALPKTPTGPQPMGRE